uniref:Uncharacterized protein n=1 Tax=Meloidogyne enterolobii TaxID=390850 RepID=A0A6V7WZW3_MELEN|nr:unnamed protein product [Meloidogyne enterolobii]
MFGINHSIIIFLIFLLFIKSKIEGSKEVEENNENNLVFDLTQREVILRKVLRASGFNTETEIDEAIIELGPPPKKITEKIDSEEVIN